MECNIKVKSYFCDVDHKSAVKNFCVFSIYVNHLVDCATQLVCATGFGRALLTERTENTPENQRVRHVLNLVGQQCLNPIFTLFRPVTDRAF